MNDFDDYQDFTGTTVIYPTEGHAEITYLALGLAGEAGELAGKVKKLLRDGEFDADHAGAELGDVLWYLARLADVIGFDLSTIAQRNVDKLRSRQERGVLGGNGDNR